MMKIRHSLSAIGCVLLLLLTSCASAGGPGPKTWIDAPLDGSTLPMGPVVVRSHAASGAGTSSAILFVNGEQVRIDTPGDPGAELVEFTQVWQPDGPGEYGIRVAASDHEGNRGISNTVHVRIGGEEAAPAATAVETTAEPAETAAKKPPTATQPLPPSIPNFTFTTPANCRKGPSTQWDVDDSFPAGESVQIDGRNQDLPRWWRVLRSSGAHCWVSDSTGTASGPTEGLQVFNIAPPPVAVIPSDTSAPPPPPPPAAKPTAPSNFAVGDKVCSSSSYEVTLSWSDSNGEDGYRVYRDGSQIASLPANTTSYDDVSPDYNGHNYFVQAFNNSGYTNGPIKGSAGCLF